jgi:hypothetical protein
MLIECATVRGRSEVLLEEGVCMQRKNSVQKVLSASRDKHRNDVRKLFTLTARQGNVFDQNTSSTHAQVRNSCSKPSSKRLEAASVLSEGPTQSKCSDLFGRAASHRQVQFLHCKHSE